MGRFKDLSGKIFGRLTVIERDYSKKGKGIYWICECNCGSTKLIRADALGNPTMSCGCLKREVASKTHKKYNKYDLSGEYGIGYTNKGDKFYFDLEDYDKIKDYCWYKTCDGYLNYKNRDIYFVISRLIMNLDDKNFIIDHIDGNPLNNRKQNLRKCTQMENTWNRHYMSNNTSGTMGVYWDGNKGKWKAFIQEKTLGLFNDIEDAKRCRLKAEKELYGEYSNKI